jgi:hypothetical protein
MTVIKLSGAGLFFSIDCAGRNPEKRTNDDADKAAILIPLSCARIFNLAVDTLTAELFTMFCHKHKEIYSAKRRLTGTPLFSNFSLSSRAMELK